MMFYIVIIGRRLVIYLQWNDCKAVVDEYSGAVFKKYANLHEATEHMNGAGYSHSDILVHTDVTSLPLRDYCHRHMMQVPFEKAPYNELCKRDSQLTMDPKDVIIQRQAIEELDSVSKSTMIELSEKQVIKVRNGRYIWYVPGLWTTQQHFP